jgi:putative membrane protein
MATSEFVPYCGNPPVPGHLTWNTDPVLIGVLALAGCAYFILARTQKISRQFQLWFAAGFVITVAAFVSPLCDLSVALFSARVTQHMILTLIAAPLLVLGRAELLLPFRLGTDQATEGAGWTLSVAGAAFAVALWTWHLPGPYDATLQSNIAYWVMHVTTLGTALLLWHGLLRSTSSSLGSALIVGFATAMQMSVLGAVLTLSSRALFSVHQGTTWPWGLSPLEDQQLGGLIMWFPAGVLFTVYALVAFGTWLHRFVPGESNRTVSGASRG